MEAILLQVLPELSGTAVIGGVFYLVMKKLIEGHNKERELVNKRLDSCESKLK